MNPSEAYRQAAEFMQALDGALEEMRKQGRLLAEAEHEYRLGRAKAYAECPPLKRGVYTSDQREADVDAMVAPLRENRDQHDVLYRSAREAVQNLRQKLSFVQSMLKVWAHEAQLEATGPRFTP